MEAGLGGSSTTRRTPLGQDSAVAGTDARTGVRIGTLSAAATIGAPVPHGASHMPAIAAQPLNTIAIGPVKIHTTATPITSDFCRRRSIPGMIAPHCAVRAEVRPDSGVAQGLWQLPSNDRRRDRPGATTRTPALPGAG